MEINTLILEHIIHIQPTQIIEDKEKSDNVWINLPPRKGFLLIFFFPVKNKMTTYLEI